MRIDSHQHFWTYDPAGYPWIEPESVLARDRLPGDLAPLLATCGIERTVAVQASQTIAETRWLLGLAEAHDFIGGVVGWVDLCASDVEAQLDSIACDELVGIRHVLQDESDDSFALRPDFQAGVSQLARRGLVYDILIYERQLDAAIGLVEKFPDQAFVVDHIAKPKIRAGEIEPWATKLRKLASFDNVCCKLSGMITEADWSLWTREDLAPYVDVTLEAFGPERLMFGSDWPVCTLAGEYPRVFETACAFLEPLSDAQREGVLGGVAARVYGVG